MSPQLHPTVSSRPKWRANVELRPLFAACLCLIALAVGACSSSDDVETSSDPDTTTTTEASSDTDDEPDTDGADIDLSAKPDVDVPEGPAPTSLVVEDIVVGDGPEAQPGDLLEMHYVGVRHSDGGQFDASWDRGETLSLSLGSGTVIQGWDEGLVGMQEGGRRLLSIPADMAYGDQARGPDIPANSALVFVVDLVKLITQPVVENAPAPVTELEVTVLEEGDGEVIEPGDLVEMHFVVVHQPTGEVVDSTFLQGQSRTLPIGVEPTQSLDAWDEGLVGKRVGDVVRLVIPPDLGFGERGGDVVGLEDTIVTEVRIISIAG